MGQLVKYELKKILSLKKAVVFLGIIILLCVGIFVFSSDTHDYTSAREMLTLYSGEVRTGLLAEAEERQEALLGKWQDGSMTEDEQEEWEALETPLWLNRCDSVRKSNLAELGIEADTLVVGDTVSYGILEEFIARYLPLILCFFISFVIAPAFSLEYENHTDSLLLAAKNGKGKVIFVKIISAVITTIALYIIVMGIYAVLTLALWGVSDPNASFVFTAGDVFIYLSSPFSFTVGQYMLLMAATSLAGCIGFCIFALFVSSKCRRSVWSSMICLAAAYIPFLSYLFIGDETSAATNILRLAYSQIISARTLFAEYSTIGPVRTVYLSLGILLLATILFTWLSYRAFRNHQVEN